MPVGAASGGSPPRASTTTMPEIDDNLFEHLEAAVVHGGDDFDADWTSREQHYMALHGTRLLVRTHYTTHTPYLQHMQSCLQPSARTCLGRNAAAQVYARLCTC